MALGERAISPLLRRGDPPSCRARLNGARQLSFFERMVPKGRRAPLVKGGGRNRVGHGRQRPLSPPLTGRVTAPSSPPSDLLPLSAIALLERGQWKARPPLSRWGQRAKPGGGRPDVSHPSSPSVPSLAGGRRKTTSAPRRQQPALGGALSFLLFQGEQLSRWRKAVFSRAVPIEENKGGPVPLRGRSPPPLTGRGPPPRLSPAICSPNRPSPF